MIISAPVNLFSGDAIFMSHRRMSLMSRAYKFIWQPRFGWKRKYITEPLMRHFLRLRSHPRITNCYHLRFRRSDGVADISISTKDLQLAPFPKGFEYGSEPDLQVLLKALSSDIVAFYDVGANFGFFSLLLASQSSFTGKIYAFEPTPSTYKNLRTLAGTVDNRHCIETIEAAVSDKPGQVHMSLPVETHSGYARIGKAEGNATYSVPAIALDSWQEEGARLGPDFMKIDVEGHELQVLHGADGLISRYRPFIYFENAHNLPNSEHDAITSFFANKNYRIFVPTWMYEKHDLWSTCRLPVQGQENHLALIDISNHPELLYDRKLLMVLNLFACPAEKVELLRMRLKNHN